MTEAAPGEERNFSSLTGMTGMDWITLTVKIPLDPPLQ